MKKLLRRLLIFMREYGYDWNIFQRYSGANGSCNGEGQLLGIIVARYHVIEKGLTMPSMRLGFGKENLIALDEAIDKYTGLYGVNNEQLLHAVKVMLEYEAVHVQAGYQLDEDLQLMIRKVRNTFLDLQPSQQVVRSRKDYFADIFGPFPDFANSRHSVRDFDGSAGIDVLKRAVELARTAPSACNRQPVRVHIATGLSCEALLSLQSGNRGFGHLCEEILVVTADVSSYLSYGERNCAYVDGGIFLMNLLYSLHSFKVGACPLNWCVNAKIDKAAREIIEIPESEVIICIVAVGKIPENIKLALSPRVKIDNVLKIH